MPTRPSTPDPTGATPADQTNPFATLNAGLGAGLDFFQDWLKAAGSALPNMPGAQAATGAGGMSAWTMPTLDPVELEKRIQDLKTVQFWLEQNARMIAMTIQGLEVQRMTLSTLKGMNVSMDALRESLKARAGSAAASSSGTGSSGSDDAPAQPAAAEGSASTGGDASAEANELINPMRWWDTLTQQFTHLASQAAQTVNDSVGESMDRLKQAQAKAAEAAEAAASTATPSAARAAAGAAPASAAVGKTAPGKRAASSTTTAARNAPSRPAPARKPGASGPRGG
ncbi:MAG: hypothetical protein QM742_13305 [Aquabacterium sp.]